MDADKFLSGISRQARPINLKGVDLDCFFCRERVTEAHYDSQKETLTWWCSEDHESTIEEFKLA
jgi:hypothetical protein